MRNLPQVNKLLLCAHCEYPHSECVCVCLLCRCPIYSKNYDQEFVPNCVCALPRCDREHCDTCDAPTDEIVDEEIILTGVSEPSPATAHSSLCDCIDCQLIARKQEIVRKRMRESTSESPLVKKPKLEIEVDTANLDLFPMTDAETTDANWKDYVDLREYAFKCIRRYKDRLLAQYGPPEENPDLISARRHIGVLLEELDNTETGRSNARAGEARLRTRVEYLERMALLRETEKRQALDDLRAAEIRNRQLIDDIKAKDTHIKVVLSGKEYFKKCMRRGENIGFYSKKIQIIYEKLCIHLLGGGSLDTFELPAGWQLHVNPGPGSHNRIVIQRDFTLTGHPYSPQFDPYTPVPLDDDEPVHLEEEKVNEIVPEPEERKSVEPQSQMPRTVSALQRQVEALTNAHLRSPPRNGFPHVFNHDVLGSPDAILQIPERRMIPPTQYGQQPLFYDSSVPRFVCTDINRFYLHVALGRFREIHSISNSGNVDFCNEIGPTREMDAYIRAVWEVTAVDLNFSVEQIHFARARFIVYIWGQYQLARNVNDPPLPQPTTIDQNRNVRLVNPTFYDIFGVFYPGQNPILHRLRPAQVQVDDDVAEIGIRMNQLDRSAAMHIQATNALLQRPLRDSNAVALNQLDRANSSNAIIDFNIEAMRIRNAQRIRETQARLNEARQAQVEEEEEARVLNELMELTRAQRRARFGDSGSSSSDHEVDPADGDWSPRP